MTKLTGPRAAVIPPYIFAYLVEIAEAEGWDHAAWFAGTGMCAQDLRRSDMRVSFEQAAVVIGRAMACAPNRPLGIEVGARQSLSSCGVLGLALLSAASLRDALMAACRFHPVTGTLLAMRFEIAGAEAALIAEEHFPYPEILPFACEELFSGVTAVARILGEQHPALLRIELRYAPPPYADDYARCFGCDVAFGQPANRIVFDASILDVPLAGGDPITHATAIRVCEAELAACQPVQDVVGEIRAWLRESAGRDVAMEEVAQALNLSSRSLRRQLAAKGTSFRELVDESRAEKARQMLARSDASVNEVAYQLGFSDGREFRRSFKRWTGTVPSAAR